MNFSFNRNKTATLTADPVQASVPKLRDADLAALYYGERLGGDFYDFVRVSPSRVVFGLLDVAGRTEQNGTILAAVQETFRSQAHTLLADDNVNEADAMARICLELNRAVLDAANGVHSCPAFAGCYNENLGIVCYFNAGHTPALVRDGSGIVELPATGLPLGLFSHATCEAPMTALAPAAALLLVSRGVVEGKSKGEEFGLDRVKETLQQADLESAKNLCRTVIEDVRQFMRTPPTHNDVTALALVRNQAA
jgi:sigma-B regulation protein RsbU (phosphoserine phosphatase)